MSSVSTLLTVRSYTVNLRERVTLLDQSVSSVGRSLATKKKELLQSKRTAANLDESIDTLQGSLRILDLVKRVGDMIKEGRYWSALRVSGSNSEVTTCSSSTVPRRDPVITAQRSVPDTSLYPSTIIITIASVSNQRCSHSSQ